MHAEANKLQNLLGKNFRQLRDLFTTSEFFIMDRQRRWMLCEQGGMLLLQFFDFALQRPHRRFRERGIGRGRFIGFIVGPGLFPILGFVGFPLRETARNIPGIAQQVDDFKISDGPAKLFKQGQLGIRERCSRTRVGW